MNTQTSRKPIALFFLSLALATFAAPAGAASAQSQPPPAPAVAPAPPRQPVPLPAVQPSPGTPAPAAPLDLEALDLVPLSDRALAELAALEAQSEHIEALTEYYSADFAAAWPKALAGAEAAFKAYQGAKPLAAVLAPDSAAFDDYAAALEQARTATRVSVDRASREEIRAAEARVREVERKVKVIEEEFARAQERVAEHTDEATRKALAAKSGELKAAQAQLKEHQAKLKALEQVSGSLARAYVSVLGEGTYEGGVNALDRGRWQQAIEAFDEVIKAKGKRVEGALYWKAYAQHRLGQRGEALATLQELQKSYASSRWLNDARALEVEVRQSMGQPVRPETESDDDLKLMALNNVMMTDPDRAIPIVEKMLQGTAAPNVKRQALFLLAQAGSARSRDVLVQVAKGSGNPDLQVQAVRYLGAFGRGWAVRAPSGSQSVVAIRKRSASTPAVDTTDALADIYNSTSDVDVKREILRSFMMTRDRDRLLALAKTEKNAELRAEAVRQLGMLGAQSELFSLYGADLSTDVRQQIISAMVMSRSADRLLEIARTEKDPKLRAHAVRNLGALAGSRNFVYNVGKTAVAPAAPAATAPEPVPAVKPAPAAPSTGAKPVTPAAPRVEAPNITVTVPKIAVVAPSAREPLDPAEVAKIGDGLVGIYKSDKDADVRKAVVNSLYTMQNAKALVDLARFETDPALKKDLVQRLSMMKSKEAMDYMLELLK